MANKSTTAKLTLRISSFVLRLLLNIMFYILVIIVIVNVSKMAYHFAYQLYGPDTVKAPGTGNSIIFQIKKGESTMDIASKLENNMAIKNKYSFYLKTKFEKDVIMPGTYELSNDMTYDQILAVITDYSASIIQDPSVQEGAAADSGSDASTEGTTGSEGSADTDTSTSTDTNTDTD